MRVCVLVCWNPTFSAFCFFLLCLLLLLPYHVSIAPSLKLSIYCVAANVQRQLHNKGVWTITHLLCVLTSMRVCRVFRVCYGRVCRCAWVCGFFLVCAGTPLFSFFFCFVYSACLLLLLPYHVCITPCLKLSSSLRCGSHGTTAVVQQVYAYGGILRIMCAMIRKHIYYIHIWHTTGLTAVLLKVSYSSREAQ